MSAYQVKAQVAESQPNLRIKAGDTVWLSWTNEGGGWNQWSRHQEDAEVFTSAKKANAAARSCLGPWYNLPDITTIELVEGVFSPARKAKFTPTPARE